MKHVKRYLPLALLALLLTAGQVFAAPNQAVDINNASVEQLVELPFIGPKKAALIVERRQHEPFKSVDELQDIKGIGPKTLEKLRPHVTVSGMTRSSKASKS